MVLKALVYAILLVTVGTCDKNTAQRSTGTLQGIVGVYEGNCMPSPGVSPCEPAPLSTSVILTKPSASFDAIMLVDSVVSDANGYYEIILPVGKYSLFLRDGAKIDCNRMGCNPDCICRPVVIKKDSTTVMNATLDHASW